jgi:predicted DNA-binding transcriptional regulator AlpA
MKSDLMRFYWYRHCGIQRAPFVNQGHSMFSQSSPRWVRNKQLAAYLNVTTMTVWRWQRDPSLNFPRPSVINGNPFTDLHKVDAWMKRRVTNKAARAA